jgi:hypothetical protein
MYVNLIWYLYDIPTTAQVVHALTDCKPVSFALSWEKTKRCDRIDRRYIWFGLYICTLGSWG